MIHVILSLIRHIRAALRPPVTSTLHTLSVPALLVPARGVRRPFRLCAMLSNHTQDQILIIALCASTHGSIHDGRSIIRVQPLPLATATMPLPSHHHRPTTAHLHLSTRHNTLLLALRPSHRSSHLLFARHSATRHFTLRTALRLFARPLFALLHHLFSTSMAPLS